MSETNSNINSTCDSICGGTGCYIVGRLRETNLLINVKKYICPISILCAFVLSCAMNIYFASKTLNYQHLIDNNHDLKKFDNNFHYIDNKIENISNNMTHLIYEMEQAKAFTVSKTQLDESTELLINNLNLLANISQDKFDNISVFLRLFENHKNELKRDIVNITEIVRKHNTNIENHKLKLQDHSSKFEISRAYHTKLIEQNMSYIMTKLDAQKNQSLVKMNSVGDNFTKILNIIKERSEHDNNKTRLIFNDLTHHKKDIEKLEQTQSRQFNQTINTSGLFRIELDNIKKSINTLHSEYKIYFGSCPNGTIEYGSIKPIFVCYKN